MKFLWLLKEHLIKTWIKIQDRWHLYRYSDWISDFEGKQPRHRQHPAKRTEEIAVSFVCRAEAGDTQKLESTLRSLREQTSPCWELIMVSSGHSLPASLDKDISVRVIQEKRNFQQWAAAAASQARGDYLLFLHPGDTLSPWLVAEVKAQDAQPDILYWDEDQLDLDGRRHTPWFKPDWSPEMLLSSNYLETAAFHRDRVQFCLSELDSDAAIHNLVFALVAGSPVIQHIPQVLFHRGNGPSTLDHAAAAAEYLSTQVDSTVKAEVTARGVIRYQWTPTRELVSIIIPTRNNFEVLQRCIESILSKTAYQPYEIILMDDHSSDPRVLDYYQQFQNHPQIRVHHNQEPFNFNRVNNQGAQIAQGKTLIFLNNDTEVLEAGWLDELVRWAQIPGMGIVGTKLLYPDQTIQHAGIVVGLTGHANHIFLREQNSIHGPFGPVDWYRNVSAVTGACMVMRREVFDQLGGFDESYLLVFSDIEICVRAARQGYRVMVTPFAGLIHHEGKSRSNHIPRQDIIIACQHLRTVVEKGDPYYNRNLSYAVCRPTFRRKFEAVPVERLERIVAAKTDLSK